MVGKPFYPRAGGSITRDENQSFSATPGCFKVLHQGSTLHAAEKLIFKQALYQGMTLVVPINPIK
jgi:hypothetical protein